MAQDRRLGGATFKVHDAALLYIRGVGRDDVLVLKPTGSLLGVRR